MGLPRPKRARNDGGYFKGFFTSFRMTKGIGMTERCFKGFPLSREWQWGYGNDRGCSRDCRVALLLAM